MRSRVSKALAAFLAVLEDVVMVDRRSTLDLTDEDERERFWRVILVGVIIC